jgi:hypothetical protein
MSPALSSFCLKVFSRCWMLLSRLSESQQPWLIRQVWKEHHVFVMDVQRWHAGTDLYAWVFCKQTSLSNWETVVSCSLLSPS